MKKAYVLILGLVAVVAVYSFFFGPSAHAQGKSFNQNLYFGLNNNSDVQNLQEFLTTEGVYSGPVTGNFFSLTLRAVKAFQANNDVQPPSGYFGPVTRAAANQILTADIQVYNSQFGEQTMIGPLTSSTTTTPPAASGLTMVDLLQARIGSFFQQLWSLQGKNKKVPTSTPTSTPPSSSGGGGSSDGGGATTPPPLIPAPATSSIAVTMVVSGGTATAANFTLTANDSTVASTIYSGAGASTPIVLSFVQGDAYAITEATTTISANYTIGTGAACSGTVPPTAVSCTFTNTYVAPPVPAPVITIVPPTLPNGTATPTSTLLWGAYVGDIDANPSLVASFDTLANASSNIIASFMDLSSGNFPSAEKNVVGAKGKTLLMFFEPQYSFDQLNSGKYDSILQQYAAAAAAYGSPIILAPFDEFNLNENPWGYGIGGNTPAKFIQAWQHIHSFFVNDPNVKFALVYNNVSVPADSVNTYAAYYPGAAYVDYVAVDGFNFNNTNATAQTFDQLFNPIMPYLQSLNKPILFASVGSVDYPQKSQWITYGLGTYIKQFSNVAGWVYFNLNDTAAGQNWRIDTSSSSLAAFDAVIPK